MRCSQLEARLNEVLDRRDDPRRDPEIAAHTVDCVRCRRVTAAYCAVASGAAALRSEPAIGVARPFITGRTAVAALAALAAAMLFFVTGPSPAPSPPVVAAAAAPAAVNPTPDVGALARNTSRVYVDLVRGTARSVDEAFVLASSVPPPNELLNPMLFPDDGALMQFGAKWVPVAGETLDALERAFAEETMRQL